MKLDSYSFKRIKNGNKTIELRLFDEKRKKLNLGDYIDFENSNDKCSVEIIGLFRYNTFKRLLDDFDMSYFGREINYSKKEFLIEMREIYSFENEKKYGVLGIKMKLIK